jgi:dTDP-4-amino-4,6-dideoxygalactose transaminase
VARRIEEIVGHRQEMTVPFMELKSEHQVHRNALRRVWDQVLDNAAFIGGHMVEGFERSFARFCEAKEAIGVANGTDALTLALKAVGVGPADEVIVPANSFVATAEAVVHCGATPVFVDIDPLTYTLDASRIEERITPSTKAIIPVHLYGQPADIHPVLELANIYGLSVIEDAAQAHGARYERRRVGSLADAACFSFYPAKNLGACGDGGAVVTNNDAIAAAVRKFRDHGGLKKYQHELIGHNSRLDAIQAAVLDIKLRDLEKRNQMRRQHARKYSELLSTIPGIAPPVERSGCEGVYHLYVIRLQRGKRDQLQEYLASRGVQTGIHYPTPIHRTQAFDRYGAVSCPIAEAYSEQILSLPMFPELQLEQLEYVVELISDFMESRGQD